MNEQITSSDIKNNALFWYSYISFFRGYDEINKINIDEALEVLDISGAELFEWEKNFFSNKDSKKIVKFIGGKLNDTLTFNIEFQENEIVYFLNDIYIGNLGGHFEAWFFTLEELIKFDNYELLFLLLLPMTGIEKGQAKLAKNLVIEHLKSIPKFENKAEYIAECIVNGLVMKGVFNINKIGITNNQNHSVRNIEKYPRYKEEVIELNLVLKGL